MMTVKEALLDPKLRIRLCEHRLDLFLMYYLPESFPLPFTEEHLKMIKLLEESKFEEFLIIAHRNFGKTLIVKGYILWLIAYKKVKFILIASHDGEKSSGHAFDIGLQLQVNEKILRDFGQLYWQEKDQQIKRKDKKKSNAFLCTNGIFVKATQSSVRGEQYIDDTGTYRPDFIFYDDIENLNTVKSYVITQKIIANLGESKNAKAIGGKSVYCLNRLSTSGVASFLEGRVNGGSIIMFEAKLINANLVAEKANIIHKAKTHITWKTRYVATNEQKEILNGLITDPKMLVESVENLLSDGLSVFMREYQNEPQENMEVFVKPKDIKDNYYTVEERDWNVAISIDPQSGMTTKADEYAITVLGYTNHNPNRWVIEQIVGRGSPMKQAKEFITLCLKYYDKLTKAGIEVIKTQTAVYLTVLDWMNGNITIKGLPACTKELPIVKSATKDNKENRLNRFVPAFERGEIHLKPDMLELEEQLIYFTNLPHDDRADSLILALELVNQTKGGIYEGSEGRYNMDNENETVMGNLFNQKF